MNPLAERKIQDLLLSENNTNSVGEIKRDLDSYRLLTRLASKDPTITEELEIVKEHILEKWPTVSNHLDAFFNNDITSVPEIIKALRAEGRKVPKPRTILTVEEREQHLEERKTALRNKAKNKKKPT